MVRENINKHISLIFNSSKLNRYMSEDSHSRIRIRNTDYRKSISQSTGHFESPNNLKKAAQQGTTNNEAKTSEDEKEEKRQIQRRGRQFSNDPPKKNSIRDDFNSSDASLQKPPKQIQKVQRSEADSEPKKTKIVKTSGQKRNRSVKEHVKRNVQHEKQFNEPKKTLAQTQQIPKNHSEMSNNPSKTYLFHSNNSKGLQFSEPSMSIEFYYKEKTPRPFDGELVFKLNGQTSSFQIQQDPLLQFVPNIILGPTFSSEKRSNSIEPKKRSLSSSKSSAITLKSKTEKRTRSRSVSQTSDVHVNVNSLFTDDYPNTVFDFDFANVFIHSILDDTTNSIKTNFLFSPTIEQIESSNINLNGDQQSVLYSLLSLFQSNSNQQPTHILTKLFEPDLIHAKHGSFSITPQSFSEFRFGKLFKFAQSDVLHLYTWHQLNIPATLISKNLLILFQTNITHQHIKALIQCISQYIIEWITHFPLDFYGNSNNSELIDSLLKAMATKSRSSLDFINIIGTVIYNLNKKIILPTHFSEKVKQPIIKSISPVNSLIDLSIDPYIVANHFSYIDLLLLKKLHRGDFCSNSANINKNSIICRFNEVTRFICSSILIDSDKRRARNISYWIKMMYYAKRIKNFNLLAEIDCALSSYTIKRLKTSWKLVNDNALLAFSRLHNFFKKKENQMEMFNDVKLTIPFVGIFISQLSGCNFNIVNNIDDNVRVYELENEIKIMEIVEQVFWPWGVELEFEIDQDVLNECKKLNGKAKKVSELILPSFKFEAPSNNEKEILDEYL